MKRFFFLLTLAALLFAAAFLWPTPYRYLPPGSRLENTAVSEPTTVTLDGTARVNRFTGAVHLQDFSRAWRATGLRGGRGIPRSEWPSIFSRWLPGESPSSGPTPVSGSAMEEGQRKLNQSRRDMEAMDSLVQTVPRR